MERDDLGEMASVDDTIYDNAEDTLEEMELDWLSALSKLKIDPDSEVVEGYPSKRLGQILDKNLVPKPQKHNEDMTIQDVLKEHVLRFLPAKTLCRFKSVCKDWNQWINNPFLAHLQSCYFRNVSGLFCQIPHKNPFFVSLDRSACGLPRCDLGFFPEPVTIRATSNGLVLCASAFEDDHKSYYICNPTHKKKQWKSLPEPKLYHGQGSVVALAFDPSMLNFTPCFEVVCAVPLADSPVLFFEIYSSRSNSWRVAETQCWDQDALVLKGDGLFFNGVVFWETKSGAVLAFDLKDEQYSTISLPPSNGFEGSLTRMFGELCYIRPQIGDPEKDELEMEVYGDLNMTLKHKIPLSLEVLPFVVGGVGELRALTCVNDDVLVFLVGKKLCAYHVKEERLELIINTVKRIDQDDDVKLLPYVNSFVSVEEMSVGFSYENWCGRINL